MPEAVADLLAIDIALLLPADAFTRVGLLNVSLSARGTDGFRFDATHLPHVTLAQLFVSRRLLSALYRAVGAVLRKTGPVELRTAGLGRGRTAVFIRLSPGSQLMQLHTRLMDTVLPFEARDAGRDAFYTEGEPARRADLQWVSQFRTHSSYDHFNPHITLGLGGVAEPEPFTFVASRVAACHLGRFCTCRAILRDWRLKPRSA